MRWSSQHPSLRSWCVLLAWSCCACAWSPGTSSASQSSLLPSWIQQPMYPASAEHKHSAGLVMPWKLRTEPESRWKYLLINVAAGTRGNTSIHLGSHFFIRTPKISLGETICLDHSLWQIFSSCLSTENLPGSFISLQRCSQRCYSKASISFFICSALL